MKNGFIPNNNVMVKLDPENDRVTTKSGVELFIDNTFEPEKHITLTGTVIVVPDRLKFNPRDADAWKTDMEVQVGDKVVMYYLAVQNCLRPERKKFIKEGNERYIFIDYRNIYAAIRDGNVLPVNGHILIEPLEDPESLKKEERLKKVNIHLLRTQTKTIKKVVYGRVVYVGTPNKEYSNKDLSDHGINIEPGDRVILKKVRDIPIEYELHAKIDNGRKLYRVQRHDILAVL